MFQVGTEKITVYQKKTVESAKKLVRDTLPSGFDIHIQISQKKPAQVRRREITSSVQSLKLSRFEVSN